MADPISAIVGSVSQRNQAKSAARATKAAGAAQEGAIGQAIDKQEEQYGINKGYFEPYQQQGVAGQNQLSYLMGVGKEGDVSYADVNKDIGQFGTLSKSFTLDDFSKDPSYNFVMSEGAKALDRNASAKRKYFSGESIKALQRFNQDTASKEYGNAYNRYRQNQQDLYNRWGNVADTGYNAGAAMSNLGSEYAANYGNLITNKGDVQASTILGVNKNKANQADANAALTAMGINAAIGAGGGFGGAGGFSGAMSGVAATGQSDFGKYTDILKGFK